MLDKGHWFTLPQGRCGGSTWVPCAAQQCREDEACLRPLDERFATEQHAERLTFAKRRHSETFGQVEDDYRAIAVNRVRVNTTTDFHSALSVAGLSTVTFELLQAEGGGGGGGAEI